jgi:hypothetical protein
VTTCSLEHVDVSESDVESLGVEESIRKAIKAYGFGTNGETRTIMIKGVELHKHEWKSGYYIIIENDLNS